MSEYASKIKIVEELLRKADSDLKVAINEEDRINQIERRSQLFSELRTLKRLEWEEQHDEPVGSEDER